MPKQKPQKTIKFKFKKLQPFDDSKYVVSIELNGEISEIKFSRVLARTIGSIDNDAENFKVKVRASHKLPDDFVCEPWEKEILSTDYENEDKTISLHIRDHSDKKTAKNSIIISGEHPLNKKKK